MKAFITGGTGFVGSWLTEFLVKKGFEVSLLYRKTSNLNLVKHLKVKLVLGDLNDPKSLEKALIGQKVVFHLGGLVGYGQTELMEKVNVEGTYNLIEAVKKTTNLERFVHFSSVAAIGAGFHPSDILNENSSYNIGHLSLGYFDTKKKAEDLVRNSGLNAVILNPSTIYGPRDSTKQSRRIQLKVAQGRFLFYTPGGVSIVHIKDVIQATLKAFEKGVKGERYILSGDNLTIKELFKTIASLSSVSPPRLYLPKPILKLMGSIGLMNKEVATISTLYHFFDHSKAKKELSFLPQSSRKALQDSLEWSKKQGLL